jgi:hypothetical protein
MVGTDAPEAPMHTRTAIILIATTLAGCGQLGLDGNVRSARFPLIAIRCEGDKPILTAECLRWVEQSLASSRGIEARARSVVVAFHRAEDGTRCAASTSFFGGNGGLIATIGRICPGEGSASR